MDVSQDMKAQVGIKPNRSTNRLIQERLRTQSDRVNSKRAALQSFITSDTLGTSTTMIRTPTPVFVSVDAPRGEVTIESQLDEIQEDEGQKPDVLNSTLRSSDESDGSFEADSKEKSKGAASAKATCGRMVPLAVGLAALAAVSAGIFFYMDNNNLALKSSAQSPDFQGIVSSAEMALHNTPSDCWVLIGGTVYDLSNFAPTHPGGARLITDHCATDATEEYKLEHPLSLLQTLQSTVIGTMEEGYVLPNGGRDDDDEYDEEEQDETVVVVPRPTTPPAPTPPAPTPGEQDPSVVSYFVLVVPCFFPFKLYYSSDLTLLQLPDLELGPVTAFISEMHYDNIGSDQDQMIEVAFSNHLDVSGYKVEFYRGKTGLAYNTESVQAFAIGASRNGLTFATRGVGSFQNGPDGVALIDEGDRIVEFISYGGLVTPLEGYAVGLTSVDIGVEQTGVDPIGWTLQKTGSGCLGSEFQWGVNAQGTMGDVNVEMEVTCFGDGQAVPAPAPWAETLAPTAACFAEHYGLTTISEHGTPQDCWLAVYGIVYDFTAFAFEHEGGPEEILPLCGTDASVAYADRHSRSLLRKVVEFIIGRLGDVDGLQSISCERRLEHAESGYWDDEWGSVQEFEEYLDDEEGQ
jgi:cytochrome b involved in lipid metabolism